MQVVHSTTCNSLFKLRFKTDDTLEQIQKMFLEQCLLNNSLPDYKEMKDKHLLRYLNKFLISDFLLKEITEHIVRFNQLIISKHNLSSELF